MKTAFCVLLMMTVATWAIETIIIQPDCWEGKDAYINLGHPDYNYGSHSTLHIAYYLIRPYQLTLIQFNLPELPPEAELVSADLVLWCTGVSSDSEYLKIVAVQDLWHEGIVCWNTQPEYRPDKVVISGTPEEDTWAYFNITTFVADWYSSEYENHGMYLIPGTESSVAFASSDNNDENEHPKLIVRYSCMDVEETSWGGIKATYK